ncbi:MAG: TetR/AcrR family transcriptional regulator [Cyanobacteria bacterium]|nr:TetR/AcrR family transcriptional regulator [Cyanobacteriota bacterium]
MQKLDPQKKTAILEAARCRFHRYGIQKTSMKDIAQDVGLAVGTLYLYFRNKDEILKASTDNFKAFHQAEAYEIVTSSLSPAEKLKSYLLKRFHMAKRTREGGDHATEIASAVLRLFPQRLVEESQLMGETVQQILTEGMATEGWKVENLDQDTEVFLYSIAYFFPVAGKEPFSPVTEKDLVNVIQWFIKTWSPKP